MKNSCFITILAVLIFFSGCLEGPQGSAFEPVQRSSIGQLDVPVNGSSEPCVISSSTSGVYSLEEGRGQIRIRFYSNPQNQCVQEYRINFNSDAGDNFFSVTVPVLDPKNEPEFYDYVLDYETSAEFREMIQDIRDTRTGNSLMRMQVEANDGQNWVLYRESIFFPMYFFPYTSLMQIIDITATDAILELNIDNPGGFYSIDRAHVYDGSQSLGLFEIVNNQITIPGNFFSFEDNSHFFHIAIVDLAEPGEVPEQTFDIEGMTFPTGITQQLVSPFFTSQRFLNGLTTNETTSYYYDRGISDSPNLHGSDLPSPHIDNEGNLYIVFGDPLGVDKGGQQNIGLDGAIAVIKNPDPQNFQPWHYRDWVTDPSTDLELNGFPDAKSLIDKLPQTTRANNQLFAILDLPNGGKRTYLLLWDYIGSFMNTRRESLAYSDDLFQTPAVRSEDLVFADVEDPNFDGNLILSSGGALHKKLGLPDVDVLLVLCVA